MDRFNHSQVFECCARTNLWLDLVLTFVERWQPSTILLLCLPEQHSNLGQRLNHWSAPDRLYFLCLSTRLWLGLKRATVWTRIKQFIQNNSDWGRLYWLWISYLELSSSIWHVPRGLDFLNQFNLQSFHSGGDCIRSKWNDNFDISCFGVSSFIRFNNKSKWVDFIQDNILHSSHSWWLCHKSDCWGRERH